jgi:nitroimidazol reductase NimA-like FMN-containing flavoprotein (pyridoxamine 5'-phosphate oxidase superfamily)
MTSRRLVQLTLSSQVQAVLATVGPELQPQTHLMAYAASEDLSTVYLATSRSRKWENMQARPSVSLLWDNRTGNLVDHGDGLLVTASGRAALISEEDEVGAATRLFLEKNPNMKPFLASDGVGVFKVTVGAFEVVEGYGKPTSWKPEDG